LDIPREKKRSRRRYLYIALAIVGVVVVSVGISRLQPAAPSVDGSTLWRDTVKLGTMVREVRGPGTLVPEDIRWISALTAGRVEKINLLPGSLVRDTTELLVLSNPDEQLLLLEAQQQLTAAQANLVSLKASLQSQRLTQEAAIAQLKTQEQQAERAATTAEGLASRNLIAANDLKSARDSEEELKTRLSIQQQELQVLDNQITDQLKVQQDQVDRLHSIVVYRQQELESMHVMAGANGVLQDLPLQVGQWVTPGSVLAKVVEPGRLKATLRVPETQARDVQLGQSAKIDTRNGIINGHVMRIDPAAQNGTVGVDVRLEGEMPKGARPDLSVDGTIEVDRLPNVLYVGRPAYGQPDSPITLFKLTDNGHAAVRVHVLLGQASVNTVEIRSGLSKGDIVILSDMSTYDNVDRVRIQ
jgi:HlyD family secretion protein